MKLPDGVQFSCVFNASCGEWSGQLCTALGVAVQGKRGGAQLIFRSSHADVGELFAELQVQYVDHVDGSTLNRMTVRSGSIVVGSRWVHRSGGRICVVDAVSEEEPSGALIVRYHYEQTAGAPPGRVRRARGTPLQTMPLKEWRALFTVEAPPSKASRKRSV